MRTIQILNPKNHHSSHPGKKVVDVAFKASKSIDWDGVAKMIVSDEARKEFSSFCRAFEEVNSTLQTKFSQGILPLATNEGLDVFTRYSGHRTMVRVRFF
ncbi:putative ATP synthase, F0 complex, subunit D [Helianthus anomalus]